MIDSELTALQAACQSDGAGRVLGMDSRCCKNEQMALVRTGRRLPVSAGRTDPKEVETSDVVTSMHGSRGDSAQLERSLERGVKGKNFLDVLLYRLTSHS